MKRWAGLAGILIAVVWGILTFVIAPYELQRVLFGTAKDMALVHIMSDPEGAEIESSDGRQLGTAPLTTYVRLTWDDKVEIRAQKDGYQMREPIVRSATPGDELFIRINLTPVPHHGEKGRRDHNSHPSEASASGMASYLVVCSFPRSSIEIDGENEGSSGNPVRTGKYITVAPGPHMLTLQSLNGPRNVTRALEIEAGKTQFLGYNFLEEEWACPSPFWR